MLVACNKEEVPDGVIAKKQLVPLLCDFHLAEGYISSLPMDSSRLMAKNYYASVFKKYNTDSAGFHKTLIFYSRKPGELNQIYAEVQRRLQQYQTREQAIVDAKMKEAFVADSIQNASVRDSVDKIQSDSLNLQLTKHLLYWKNADSTQLKPKPWSLPLENALVKRWLYIPDGNNELTELLMPVDSLINSDPVE